MGLSESAKKISGGIGRNRSVAVKAIALHARVAAASHEQMGYLVARRREALQLPHRLEAAHDLRANPGRLMRVLPRLFNHLVLAALEIQARLFVRDRIALEFVGDQHARSAAMLLHQLEHQALCGVPFASALNQTTSSRCHLSPRAGAVARIRRAMPSPNLHGRVGTQMTPGGACRDLIIKKVQPSQEVAHAMSYS